MTPEERAAHCRRISRLGAQKGGQARAKAFTPEYQRAAGRRRWETAVEKHGALVAADIFAGYRRKNPSSLEKIVITWLDGLGASYEREVKLGDFCYVDFLVSGQAQSTAIEVDGQYWHEPNAHYGEDREGRDRAKDARVRALGHQVLRLAERDIRSGAALQQLREFLQS